MADYQINQIIGLLWLIVGNQSKNLVAILCYILSLWNFIPPIWELFK